MNRQMHPAILGTRDLEENEVSRRQQEVFTSGHLRFVERLLAEQAEAWRSREISLAEAAHAIVHGAEFVAGTLCHAPYDMSYGPMQGTLQVCRSPFRRCPCARP